jgi:hypothetical protein
MHGTMFAIWGANRSGSMPCSMRSSWTSAAPNYRAIGSESMRPSGPDVERRRQRGIADKAVDVRAITTSELELSAPIDTEYAELRPPVAAMEGPNVAARQRGRALIREALKSRPA